MFLEHDQVNVDLARVTWEFCNAEMELKMFICTPSNTFGAAKSKCQRELEKKVSAAREKLNEVTGRLARRR